MWLLWQGYGLTESAGSVTRMIDAEETKMYASVGRLAENMEAKIVDPVTGQALPPGKKGELWLRGPTIMRGDTTFLHFTSSFLYIIIFH